MSDESSTTRANISNEQQSDIVPAQQESQQTISKNQLKRNKREEYLKSRKKEKKEAEKKKKLEKRLANPITEKRVIDSDLGSSNEVVTKRSRKECKLEAAELHRISCNANFSVIIDCGWETDHTDSSLKSLTQQIMFSYGANKRHSNPVNMHLTGLGPRLKARLSAVMYEHWAEVTLSDEDYIQDTARFTTASAVLTPSPSIMNGVTDRSAAGEVSSSSSSSSVPVAPKQLVYLTSDAEETLESLDPSCAYIIGGIVDRNRLKGATYNKAKAQGVRTAKLPIKENFSLASTHILTVNHVFEILLHFGQCGSWPEAIERVIPKRKGLAVKPEAPSATAREKQPVDGSATEETTASTEAAGRDGEECAATSNDCS